MKPLEIMQKREKKKQKEEEEEKYGVLASFEHRNWSTLPDLALEIILGRLPSIPDVLSFTSVCRSWPSLYSVFDLNSLPPLLLLPVLSSTSHQYWSQPPRCRLKTLSLQTRIIRSPVKSETRTLPCLGYSRGHLVFASPPSLLLVDVFTGQQTRIRSPPVDSLRPTHALLTDSDLVLACDSLVLSNRPFTDSWSRLYGVNATSLLEFRGQVLCLHSCLVYGGFIGSLKLGVLELNGTSVRFTPMKMIRKLTWLPIPFIFEPSFIGDSVYVWSSTPLVDLILFSASSGT